MVFKPINLQPLSKYKGFKYIKFINRPQHRFKNIWFANDCKFKWFSYYPVLTS